MIDWLRRSSNLITKEGFPSYDQRVESQQRLTDESGNDITAFEHMVREKCPNLPEHWVKRLVKTMIIRQKNIISRRSTRDHWASELGQSPRDLTNISRWVLMDPESGKAVSPRAEENDSHNVSARHNAHAESSLVREEYKEHAAPFPTSRARTHASSSNVGLRFSALPRPAFPKQVYICGYCHMIFSSNVALDDIGWV